MRAYLIVNTSAYAAPSPNTGYPLGAVPAYTEVWVVEKVWCDYNDRYYYYAGYTLNGESHRAYFCEDNVYKDGSRYLPANVTAESKPAGLKIHTSLAGTVYDGPATTYATMGSVGQESIKLIRTEGDYNFIEYTVAGTTKYKRGFLLYTKITGEWATLTAQTKNKLNGCTFFIRNRTTGKYMDVKSWSTAENTRIHQWNYHGDSN